MKTEKTSAARLSVLNIKRSRIAAAMILVLSVLCLIASVIGVLDKNLYTEVYLAGTLPETNITGSVAQDIVIIPISVASIVLAVSFLYRPGYKSFISLLGLAWCFFYAYGLYVIQGQYTSIYLVYMAIFGLSLYSLIFGLLSFKPSMALKTRLPRLLQIGTGIYFILTLCVLVPGWLIRITPDIARHVPGHTYAVYILDLCMVFPAFAIITYQLLRKQSFGNILAGVALLKGFTLCLTWGFSEVAAPLFNKTVSYDMAAISSALTIFGLALFIPYIIKLKVEE